MTPKRRWPLMTATLALISAAVLVAMPALAAGSCSARSAATAVPVIELYTSEGCSSCPPADQWLSRMKADPDVVALAFHVDYWDRLGWKDRFSSAGATQRQAQLHRSSGGRFSYTPQVLLDGADRKDWPSLAAPLSKQLRPASPVDVEISRDGAKFTATVAPLPGTATRLEAYWAVTEQGHITAVKAGENDGATLKHEYVVREYRAVPAWAAQVGTSVSLQFEPQTAADAAHPRQINLVVVSTETGRPVQAVKLGC